MKKTFFTLLALIVAVCADAQVAFTNTSSSNYFIQCLPADYVETATFSLQNNSSYNDAFVDELIVDVVPNGELNAELVAHATVRVTIDNTTWYNGALHLNPITGTPTVTVDMNYVLVPYQALYGRVVVSFDEGLPSTGIFGIYTNVTAEYDDPDTGDALEPMITGPFVFTMQALHGVPTSTETIQVPVVGQALLTQTLGTVVVKNTTNTAEGTWLPIALNTLHVELQGNIGGQTPTSQVFTVLDAQGNILAMRTMSSPTSYGWIQLDNELTIMPGDSVLLTIAVQVYVQSNDFLYARVTSQGLVDGFEENNGTVVTERILTPRVDFVTPTGISETASDVTFKAFPNPTTGYQTIVAKEQVTITVYDISGKQVLNQTVQPNGQLDLTTLPVGMYAMQAVGKDGKIIATGKLLKE